MTVGRTGVAGEISAGRVRVCSTLALAVGRPTHRKVRDEWGTPFSFSLLSTVGDVVTINLAVFPPYVVGVD